MGFYQKKLGYKAPDVKAPRFRRNSYKILNEDLYNRYIEANPGSKLTYDEFKNIILAFNKKVCETIIMARDGVELPEQLGYIFVGSCPRKVKSPNTDPTLSAKHSKNINYKNWDSNQYVCKIFYSNYGTKYKFQGRDLWFFTPSRYLKRSVSKEYRKSWNRYRKVSPFQKVSSLFFKQGLKRIKVDKHDYNNRGVDFSNTQPE